MNVQHSHIGELIFYEFELGYNTMQAMKNIVASKKKVSWWQSPVEEILLGLQELQLSGNVRLT